MGCILQDKKDLRPTAQKHLENIFNKTWSTIKSNQELQARAACMEYECNQGDHSFF